MKNRLMVTSSLACFRYALPIFFKYFNNAYLSVVGEDIGLESNKALGTGVITQSLGDRARNKYFKLGNRNERMLDACRSKTNHSLCGVFFELLRSLSD